jgi:hypothetical protein
MGRCLSGAVSPAPRLAPRQTRRTEPRFRPRSRRRSRAQDHVEQHREVVQAAAQRTRCQTRCGTGPSSCRRRSGQVRHPAAEEQHEACGRKRQASGPAASAPALDDSRRRPRGCGSGRAPRSWPRYRLSRSSRRGEERPAQAPRNTRGEQRIGQRSAGRSPNGRAAQDPLHAPLPDGG